MSRELGVKGMKSGRAVDDIVQLFDEKLGVLGGKLTVRSVEECNAPHELLSEMSGTVWLARSAQAGALIVGRLVDNRSGNFS